MNGAEALARTLVACGIDTVFANPGTSEMHFVSALDRVPGLRCVLGLAETAVAGMADGYGRIAARPAAALYHCGPGLGNATANLHNARRAHTPMLNIVGDHATGHRPLDAPLTYDVEGLARTLSPWVRTIACAAQVGADAAAAVQAACTPPGQSATLILPADAAWDEGAAPGLPCAPAPPLAPAPENVAAVARALRAGGPAMLLLSGRALSARGLAAAARVAAATGALLRAPTQVPRIARGRGRPAVDRLPYSVDRALELLAPLRTLVLAGARPPVGFFAYPGKPGMLWPRHCALHVLGRIEEDLETALERLADELGAPPSVPAASTALPERPGDAFSPEAFAALFAHLIPEDAIVIEDAVTSGRMLFAPTAAAAPHDWIQITGGAIGWAFPAAAGAAVAAPGRKAICLQADGAGMYSLQALWSQARERLDVVNVVFANRRYAILQGELAAVGAAPGPASRALFDLSRPDLDWVRLAEGMGVAAERVEGLRAFERAFRAALAACGPRLIELRIP